MRKHSGILVVAGFTAGFIAAVPSVSEASFFRSLSGGSTGGSLSRNGSTSTQQLTSDPDGILAGSVSTEYDPSVVRLTDMVAGPFFDNTSALIGIRLPEDLPTAERFVTGDAFFTGLPYAYTETGYVQVTFFRDAEADGLSVIDPFPGFVIIDEDGFNEGDDTHALFFTAVNPASNDVAAYRIYREDGTQHDVLPDYLMTTDEQVITSGINESNVSGVVPEPAAAGLLGLAGGALALRRRRRRV